MKLWVDGKNGSAGSAIVATIKEQVTDVNRKVVSRGVRAVNAIRNAELEVLKGQRSGRVYRKPYTKSATYTASAPENTETADYSHAHKNEADNPSRDTPSGQRHEEQNN